MRGNRIVMVVLALVSAGGFVLADDGFATGEAHGRWDLSGTIIGSTAYGTWIASYVPLDNSLKSYYCSYDGIWDPTAGGYFFWVTQSTDYAGQCDRTGQNSFKCTSLAYGADALFKVQLIYVTYENLERLPDKTVMRTMDVCVYGSDQDPFGEEYPDYGCWPGTPGVSNWRTLVVRDMPLP